MLQFPYVRLYTAWNEPNLRSHQPPFWAIHTYAAMNGAGAGRLQRFLNWGPAKRRGNVWITETGAYLYTKSGQVSGGETTQANRLANFLSSSVYRSNSRVIKRFYYYLWHENSPQPRAGSGLPGIPDTGLVEYDRSRTREVYCTYAARTAPGTTCQRYPPPPPPPPSD